MHLRRFLRLFGLWLCLFALLNSFGGHWLALQGAAWARMLVQNSQHFQMKTAIKRTFDGDHPCSLCHKIAKGRSSEPRQSQSILQDTGTAELYLARIVSVKRSIYPNDLVYASWPHEKLAEVPLAPPLPPPQTTA